MEINYLGWYIKYHQLPNVCVTDQTAIGSE
jgi:hypothetical protein